MKYTSHVSEPSENQTKNKRVTLFQDKQKDGHMTHSREEEERLKDSFHR